MEILVNQKRNFRVSGFRVSSLGLRGLQDFWFQGCFNAFFTEFLSKLEGLHKGYLTGSSVWGL